MKSTIERRAVFILSAALVVGILIPRVLHAQTAQTTPNQSSTTTQSTSSTTKSTKSKKSKAADTGATSSTSAGGTTTPSNGQPAASNNTPAAGSSGGSTKATSSNVQAQTPPSPGMVWVNTNSKVYHKPGSQYYGKTKQGKWMTEPDAIKAGYRAASKE